MLLLLAVSALFFSRHAQCKCVKLCVHQFCVCARWVYVEVDTASSVLLYDCINNNVFSLNGTLHLLKEHHSFTPPTHWSLVVMS